MIYDVEIENHGGDLWTITPFTNKAREWLKDNIATNAETQWWGDSLVVEHRYINDIVNQMDNDGLEVFE